MAKRTDCFEDAKGKLHKRPDDATRADLTALITNGSNNTDDSIAPGIAAKLFDNRKAIERIFQDHDEMTGKLPTVEAG